MTEHEGWGALCGQLVRWHSEADRPAAEVALRFVEVELRARIPTGVRRRWSAEAVEDALQGFLSRLLTRPLPAGIEAPERYIHRSFRNWCIDIERTEVRRPTDPWEESIASESFQREVEAREELAQTCAALDSLRIEDRVVIKMADAPRLLTWEELDWLARRASLSAMEVRDRLLGDIDGYGLTLIFDPGHEPMDAKGRRDRMERFRKRRERARIGLLAALGKGA